MLNGCLTALNQFLSRSTDKYNCSSTLLRRTEQIFAEMKNVKPRSKA